jgi:hypothetical protein
MTGYLLAIALLIFSVIFVFKLFVGSLAYGVFTGVLMRDMLLCGLVFMIRLICLPFRLLGRIINYFRR